MDDQHPSHWSSCSKIYTQKILWFHNVYFLHQCCFNTRIFFPSPDPWLKSMVTTWSLVYLDYKRWRIQSTVKGQQLTFWLSQKECHSMPIMAPINRNLNFIHLGCSQWNRRILQPVILNWHCKRTKQSLDEGFTIKREFDHCLLVSIWFYISFDSFKVLVKGICWWLLIITMIFSVFQTPYLLIFRLEFGGLKAWDLSLHKCLD